MEAAHPDSGKKFTDEELRNEVLNLLLAGHETTANGLSWIFYHLLKEKEGKKLYRKDKSNFIKESLRLKPPIWAIVRNCKYDTQIGDYEVKKGDRILLSPYVTHRHNEFWDKSANFNPPRFEEPLKSTYSYIPYGGGPRICLGMHLANLELNLISSYLIDKFEFEMPPQEIKMDPGIALKIKNGLKVRIKKRS